MTPQTVTKDDYRWLVQFADWAAGASEPFVWNSGDSRSDPYAQCAYCRDQPGEPRSLQWDHVLPESRGGSDKWYNLVLACQPCNGSKNASLPMEWWKRLEERYLNQGFHNEPMPFNQLQVLWNMPTLFRLEVVALRVETARVWKLRDIGWLNDLWDDKRQPPIPSPF